MLIEEIERLMIRDGFDESMWLMFCSDVYDTLTLEQFVSEHWEHCEKLKSFTGYRFVSEPILKNEEDLAFRAECEKAYETGVKLRFQQEINGIEYKTA